mmetsp:Transcript_11323/g.26063  ORF Transcript_11323/g.26063 Transcript_11323/m.26063 type:complete len:469 (+) Transcript_11323:86-1492(+)
MVMVLPTSKHVVPLTVSNQGMLPVAKKDTFVQSTYRAPQSAGECWKEVMSREVAEPLPYSPPPMFSGAYRAPQGFAGALAPPPMWRLPERYKLQRQLGSGAFGTVREVVDTHLGRQHAVKRIDAVFAEPCRCRSTLREVTILARLAHPNIVRLSSISLPAGKVTPTTELYMIMSLSHSDLHKMLRLPCIALTSLQRTAMSYGLLCALKYLHSGGLCHRDIKPANCLVNEDCSIQLCDFGLACRVADITKRAEKMAPADAAGTTWASPLGSGTTLWYSAPELLLCQRGYTEAIDIWSAGCVLAELMAVADGAPLGLEERGPIFPGAATVPGPAPLGAPCDGKHEQLRAIFAVLGTPREEAYSHIQGPAADYLRRLPHQSPRCLESNLPGATAAEVGLLKSMLDFVPQARKGAAALVAMDLFREVRDLGKENVILESVEPILDEAAAPVNLDDPPYLEEFQRLAWQLSKC